MKRLLSLERERRFEAGSPKSEEALNGVNGFKFEKLIIWQKAMEIGEAINSMSYSFPKAELFNLTSQIRRAVDSVALNISEGISW